MAVVCVCCDRSLKSCTGISSW